MRICTGGVAKATVRLKEEEEEEQEGRSVPFWPIAGHRPRVQEGIRMAVLLLEEEEEEEGRARQAPKQEGWMQAWGQATTT